MLCSIFKETLKHTNMHTYRQPNKTYLDWQRHFLVGLDGLEQSRQQCRPRHLEMILPISSGRNFIQLVYKM
jgi:hypothetical protein